MSGTAMEWGFRIVRTLKHLAESSDRAVDAHGRSDAKSKRPDTVRPILSFLDERRLANMGWTSIAG